MLKNQILWKPVQWEPSYSLRTHGQIDTTKVMVAFRNSEKTPKQKVARAPLAWSLYSLIIVHELIGGDNHTNKCQKEVAVTLVVFRRVCGIAKRDNLTSPCQSVLTEQLESHWTSFREIWYLSIFRKSVYKIQVSLISDRNNGYFT
jgi:hypothetical protein